MDFTHKREMVLGLLRYIPDKPVKLKDSGVIYNEKTGITESGKKIFEEWRKMLTEANDGYWSDLKDLKRRKELLDEKYKGKLND